MAFSPTYTGGLFVAGGDVDGDGKADVVVSGGAAGMAATINIYSGATGAQIGNSVVPFGQFPTWVSVAAADVNGDGKADLVIGAGSGGGPAVAIRSGANLTQILATFFAYPAAFTGGVYVAAGDVTGIGHAEVITGAGPLTGTTAIGPDVRVFDPANPVTPLRDFLAYDSAFLGGAAVAAEDVDGDGKADIITGAGPTGGPHVRVFSGAIAGLELRSFFALDPGFLGGVFVG